MYKNNGILGEPKRKKMDLNLWMFQLHKKNDENNGPFSHTQNTRKSQDNYDYRHKKTQCCQMKKKINLMNGQIDDINKKYEKNLKLLYWNGAIWELKQEENWMKIHMKIN